MRKIYLVATVCFILVLAEIFFVNIGYSSDGSVTVSQPQLDTAAFTKTAQKAPAANESTVTTAQGAAESFVQMKISNSGTVKSGPLSVNGQNVERYSSRAVEKATK
jgi:hypothetical protein